VSNKIINNKVGLRHDGSGNNKIDNWMSNNAVPEELFERHTASETGPSPKISVEINSEPPGADVLIDDVPMKWQTPGYANFTEPGSHDLELRLNDRKIKRLLIIPRGEEPEPVIAKFNETND
jgi:hypothetical protein